LKCVANKLKAGVLIKNSDAWKEERRKKKKEKRNNE